MQKHKEISKTLDLFDNLLAKSELTEEDAERIGDKIKHAIAKRHSLCTPST